MPPIILFLALILAFILLIVWSAHRHSIAQARIKRLRPRYVTYSDTTYSHSHISIAHPIPAKTTWHKAYLFVSAKQIVAYPKSDKDDNPLFTIAPHQIEGFWRPAKYQEGMNLIEIHANIENTWTIHHIRLDKSRMMALVRALKELVSEEMIRAYRQRRPYIYHDPAPAQIARQNLQGAWALEQPLQLYLMPASLVFLQANNHVERMIPLRYIQTIAALRRLDTPRGGLIRLTLATTGETIAIALEDYQAWAQAIANAARRTLEEPIIHKQKKRQDDDTDPDDLYSEEIEETHLHLELETDHFLQIGEWYDGEIIQWQPPPSQSQANQ